MSKMNFEKLVDKAVQMALGNVWGESAYKINIAIIKLDQNNTSAYTRLAKCYKLDENIAQAKKMYLKALEIDPQNRVALNNLNDIEKDQKETEDVEKIKTTMELFKEGQKSMVKGRYKLASKLFARAYRNEPSLAYAINLAGAYNKMGRYDSVDKLYTQLIGDDSIKADFETIDNEFKPFRLTEESGNQFNQVKM